MNTSHAIQDQISQPRQVRPKPVDRPSLTLVRKVEIDRSRDALLTDFGRTTLEDRYLLPGESYQDMFARVATAFADDADHAQRIYDYVSKLWFMPSTPVLSNGGANRGLPISVSLIPSGIPSRASSAPGTRTFGWRPTAGASAPTGAACARLARR
jgi:ribonucleoside-diphosphate reductase alpha chain